MSQHSQFRAAELKLERAKLRLSETEIITRDYLENGAVTLTAEDDADGIHEHMMLRIAQEPTEQIALNIGEIVTHLRSALEFMTMALAVRNGAQAINDVYFPIAGTLEEFNRPDCQRKIRKLSVADQDWIRSLRPYRGGDNIIWSLNKLRSEDFHVRMLSVGARMGSYSASNIVMHNIRPGSRIIIGNFGFDLIKGGIPIHTIPKGQPHPDATISVEVAFRNIEGLDGSPIFSKLYEIYNKVYDIICKAKIIN